MGKTQEPVFAMEVFLDTSFTNHDQIDRTTGTQVRTDVGLVSILITAQALKTQLLQVQISHLISLLLRAATNSSPLPASEIC